MSVCGGCGASRHRRSVFWPKSHLVQIFSWPPMSLAQTATVSLYHVRKERETNLTSGNTLMAPFAECKWVATALHTQGGRLTSSVSSFVSSRETPSHCHHLPTGQYRYQYLHTPQRQCRYPIVQHVHCLGQHPSPSEQHLEHST